MVWFCHDRPFYIIIVVSNSVFTIIRELYLIGVFIKIVEMNVKSRPINEMNLEQRPIGVKLCL